MSLVIRVLRKVFFSMLAFAGYLVFILYARFSSKKIILLISTTGNLGNVLCTYAHLISVSERFGCKVYLLSSGFCMGIFPGLDKDWLSRFPKKNTAASVLSLLKPLIAKISQEAISLVRILPKFISCPSVILTSAKQRYILSNTVLSKLFANSKLLILSGYGFRDKFDHGHVKLQLKDVFSPNPKFNNSIIEPIKQLRSKSDLIVGLVIRHKGYENYRSGQWYFSLEQYIALMDSIEKCFFGQKVGFFVCSDSNQEEQFFSKYNYYFRAESNIENRYSLSLCDYIVSVPSSYATLPAYVEGTPVCWITDININLARSDFVRQKFVFDCPSMG